MKDVQRKMQQGVVHLGELKAETRAALQQIQGERRHIETLGESW